MCIHESDSEVGGFLEAQRKILWKKKVFFIRGSEAAPGAGRAEINTARMIFRSVASEKVSNRSRISSLDAENGYCKVRAAKRGGSEADFQQSAQP